MKALFRSDSPVMIFMSRIFDLIAISLLSVLLCAPVFTIGAVITSMYRLFIDKWRGNESSSFIKSFLKYFIGEFKVSTLYWVVNLVLLSLVSLNWILLRYYDFSGKIVVQFLLLIISIVGVLATVFIFPLLSQYNNTVSNTIMNAIFMSITHIFHSFHIIAIFLVPIVLIMIWPRLTVFFTLFGVSLPFYINSKMFSRIFKQYEDGRLKDEITKET